MDVRCLHLMEYKKKFHGGKERVLHMSLVGEQIPSRIQTVCMRGNSCTEEIEKIFGMNPAARPPCHSGNRVAVERQNSS